MADPPVPTPANPDQNQQADPAPADPTPADPASAYFDAPAPNQPAPAKSYWSCCACLKSTCSDAT